MKIAVCVPVHRAVPVDFLYSWSNLLSYSIHQGLDVGLMLSTEGSLEMKRNRLALQARQSGADYLFWLDDDHVFPMDSLVRLLKHDKPVVGCNCTTRGIPPTPTATLNGGKVQTSEEKARRGDLEQVDAIGFGMVLMKASVFDALDEWARGKGGIGCWPLFDSRVDPDGKVSTGEDMFFCALLKLAGIPVYVDHALSWEVGHLALHVNRHRGMNDLSSTPSPAGDHQGR